MNNSLFEVELTRTQIEHKEPIIVGSFILQYANPRRLELYYNFLTNFCDVKMFDGLETDTDSLAEQELEDYMRPQVRAE